MHSMPRTVEVFKPFPCFHQLVWLYHTIPTMKNSNVSAKKQVLLDFYGLHLQTVIRLKLGLLFYQFRSMLNSRYGVVQKQVPSDVAMQYGQVTKPAKKPF